MKNSLRRSALTLAISSALAVSGTSVAIAQQEQPAPSPAAAKQASSTVPSSTNQGPWPIGNKLDADKWHTGKDILGSSQIKDQAPWARAFKAAAIVAGIAAFAGVANAASYFIPKLFR